MSKDRPRPRPTKVYKGVYKPAKPVDSTPKPKKV